MKGKERAERRAQAHHLQPAVHVGQQGLTDALRQTIDDALRTRELVKVAVGRMVEETPKAMASALAPSLGAEVIQVIGRKFTLYRRNPELHDDDRLAERQKAEGR
jgi:RNA-binding protein